ncbi:MAG: sulfite exporter TauE/SafE family protein [Micromonosporaceae bacterium]
MSQLYAVLVTGLFAGGVSCAAVQGGLLAGLVARQRPEPVAASSGKRGKPVRAGAGKTARAGKTAGAGKAVRAGAGKAGVSPGASGGVGKRLVDDLAPVGGFLAGKLVSHAVVGAALGALGGLVELSLATRTYAQLAAGVLVIVFGLAQLGVPGFKDIVIQPPASWSRLARGQARSESVFAPTLLGLASVLIPCGVTLSVMALAVTSGSWWAGAATMAVFVLGTSPLFAILGYAARRAATAWRGRLAVATGVVLLVVGLYTFNGGLELAGSPLAASRIAASFGSPADAGGGSSETGDGSPVSVADGKQTVVVTAVTGAYQPAELTVKAGLPTTLVVRSENAQGCVRSFVIPSLNKQLVLPANGDTTIDLGTLKPGRLDYSCGMGMYTGALTIEA